MQCKDIPDDRVIELAHQRRDGYLGQYPSLVRMLMEEFGIPEKLALVKIESLCERKFGKAARLDYGTSPYYAWPA